MNTTVYVIVKAKRSTGPKRFVHGITVVRMTKTRPRLKRDEIAVRLTIDIPPEAFNEIAPDVKITVPTDLVVQPEVEVNVEPIA